jgi:hypothetical protein
MCFASAAYFNWIFARRTTRMLESGKVVLARTRGRVTAWNAELVPRSRASAFSAVHEIWVCAMHIVGRILPALRIGCEIASNAPQSKNRKPEHLFTAIYSGEEPLRDKDEHVLLLVSDRHPAAFPSPMIVSNDLPPAELERWMAHLEHAESKRAPEGEDRTDIDAHACAAGQNETR